MSSEPKQSGGNSTEEPALRNVSEVEPRIPDDLGWEREWSQGLLQTLGTACSIEKTEDRKTESLQRKSMQGLYCKKKDQRGLQHNIQWVEMIFILIKALDSESLLCLVSLAGAQLTAGCCFLGGGWGRRSSSCCPSVAPAGALRSPPWSSEHRWKNQQIEAKEAKLWGGQRKIEQKQKR